MKFLISFMSLLLLVSTTQAQQVVEVLTQSGNLAGALANENSQVRVFKGIPYAAAPVGQNRWRAPQSVSAWSGTRQATEYGPRCVQRGYEPGRNQPFSSEDCLSLNVWTSAESEDSKQPVMLWVHGGGFFAGTGSDARYDGTNLALKNAVVVTFNYRLGSFGFFAHPELSAESEHGVSGNYAMQDAIAALRWIKENIAAFGGDPDNVTVFGESAGGQLTASLVASDLASGLFHRAIIQSSAFMGMEIASTPTLVDAEGDGARIAELFDYQSLAHLRSLGTEEVFRNFPNSGALLVDGYLIKEDFSSLFLKGEQNNVDLLIGSNHDEATFFGPGIQQREEFIESAEGYGPLMDDFVALFPAESDEQANESYLRAFSDEAAWHARLMAKRQKEVDSRAWVYYMSYVPPGMEARGATHTAELPYMFAIRPDGVSWTQYDEVMADQMTSYWVNFSRTGNPNGQGLPQWPEYQDDSEGNVMVFGDDIEAETRLLPSAAVLDFFNRAYERHLDQL